MAEPSRDLGSEGWWVSLLLPKLLGPLLPTCLPQFAHTKARPWMVASGVRSIEDLKKGPHIYQGKGVLFPFWGDLRDFHTSQKRAREGQGRITALSALGRGLGIGRLGPGLVPLWRSNLSFGCQRVFCFWWEEEEIGEEIKAQKWKTKNSWRSDKQFNYVTKHKYLAKWVTPNTLYF